ncbi:MAG: hypothetical protein JRD89_01985 [Deltaproteobacteria bacterium]|nr:hypothetical protein [Deltaproteobacteria bacterium]
MKLGRLPNGAWHVIDRNNRPDCENGYWFNQSEPGIIIWDEATDEELLDIAANSKYGGQYKQSSICGSCYTRLRRMAEKRDAKMDIDPTKPIIICGENPNDHAVEIDQAEKKTIQAAKKLATKLVEDEQTKTARIFVLHTTILRKPSPIIEVKHRG